MFAAFAVGGDTAEAAFFDTVEALNSMDDPLARNAAGVARRAGERYFLGAGTNAEARTVVQPLRFLRPGVTYTARIYADDPASELRTAYRIEERQLTSADSLRIVMAPDGGCAVTFEPLGK